MKRPPSAGNKEGYYSYHSYQEADQNGVVVVNLELLHLLLTYMTATKMKALELGGVDVLIIKSY